MYLAIMVLGGWYAVSIVTVGVWALLMRGRARLARSGAPVREATVISLPARRRFTA